MSEEKKIQESVSVNVELACSLEHFASPEGMDGQIFRRKLLQLLEPLKTDLALPIEITLEVRVVEDEGQLTLSSYRISIQGKPCRFPLPALLSGDINASGLARSVALGIYWNRELFLTDPLLKWLWRSQVREESHDLPVDLHRLLSQCVRSGFSIERMKSVVQSLASDNTTDRNADELFEESISSWEVVSLKIFTNTVSVDGTLDVEESQQAAGGTSSRLVEMFEKIQSDIFKSLGLIIPKVTILADEALESDEIRLQINDLRFPPHVGFVRDQQVDDPLRKAIYIEIWLNAGSFLNIQVVKYNLNLLQQQLAALVRAVLARFDVSVLTHILRNLVDETFPIQDWRTILEALVAINSVASMDLDRYAVFYSSAITFYPSKQDGKTLGNLKVEDYTNVVLTSLANAISYRYTQGCDEAYIYRLSSGAYTRFMALEQQPLTETEYGQLVKSINSYAEDLPSSATPVLLVPADVRKKISDLLAAPFPWLPVLDHRGFRTGGKPVKIAEVSF